MTNSTDLGAVEWSNSADWTMHSGDSPTIRVNYGNTTATIPCANHSGTTGTGTGGGGGAAGDCNESKVHNNDEKALFHGLKSAYRLSRTSDGEYGVDGEPPYETAARLAANVAIAFFQTTDQRYTREASFEYIAERFARDVGVIEDYLSDPPLDTRVGDAEFEAAIDQAWHQVDSKQNHFDAARTALAAADLYLGGELDALVQQVTDDPDADTGTP